MILVLYSIGLMEGYYLPHYGIEWTLLAIGGTAFLAGFWIKSRWD